MSPYALPSAFLSVRVLLALTSLIFLFGCEDDLYDTGRCTVTELPNGQGHVQCENGDALLIGDVVGDGVCQLRQTPDGSRVLVCDSEGDSYVIPPPDTQVSSCAVVGSNSQECETINWQSARCAHGLDGSLSLGQSTETSSVNTLLRDTFVRYGCTTLHGDLEIQGILDAADLEVLRHLEVITGNLRASVGTIPLLSFPELREVHGRIQFASVRNVTELHFPQLTHAGEFAVNFAPNLQIIHVPKLERLDTFELNNLPELETIDLPQLRHVEKVQVRQLPLVQNFELALVTEIVWLTVRELERLTSIRLPQLTGLEHLYFNELPSLPSLSLGQVQEAKTLEFITLATFNELSMPNLRSTNMLTFIELPNLDEKSNLDQLESVQVLRVSGSAFPDNIVLSSLTSLLSELTLTSLTRPVTLDFQKIRTINGPVTVNNNEHSLSLHFPILESVIRLDVQNNDALHAFTAPQLDKISLYEGHLIFDGNQALTELSLPRFLGQSRPVQISNNPQLESLVLSQLLDVSDLTITDNLSLESLDVPALRAITNELRIQDNPLLPKCIGNSILTQLLTAPVTISIETCAP